ncbi:MAG: NTP transferase domain-containing protein [Acidobacteria bacterium]|nr:NTP transferase domain-containing protein [Acidobacteriota bacterium]
MSRGLTLAILAAGRSARFGRPKTLEPVGPAGEVLFEYAICDAVRAGCGKVVFVTSADWNDQLMSRAAEQAGGAVPVDSVIQSLDDLPGGAAPPAGRAKPWGTGHAVLALRRKIEEPFLVVNADDFYGARAVESFGRQAADRLARGDDSHFLAAYELHRTGVSRSSGVNRGILTVRADSTLEGIDEVYDVRETDSGLVGRGREGEARSLAPDCPCSMNLWAFQPSIFGLLEAAFVDFHARLDDPLQNEFLLSETVGQLIDARSARVRLLPMTQNTAGLTYPGDLPPVASTLRQCVEAGDYPDDLGDWFADRASRRPA